MVDEEVLAQVAALLAEQQGLSFQITETHGICCDLGVCGGDFQDFMDAVWRKFDLPREEVVYLGAPEQKITVGDVAMLVIKAKSK
jgi:hypothetical protein